MLNELRNLKSFLAVFTVLGTHLADVLVPAKFMLLSLKVAVLTFDWRMSLLVVSFAVLLRHHQSTLLAFVVHARALHLVHAMLGDFDVALAISTDFCLCRLLLR